MKFGYSTCFGKSYRAIAPCVDTDALAAIGDRLMMRHGSPTQPQLAVFRAKKGVLTGGWVIGMFDEEGTPAPTETWTATPGARFPFAGASTVRFHAPFDWKNRTYTAQDYAKLCAACGQRRDLHCGEDGRCPDAKASGGYGTTKFSVDSDPSGMTAWYCAEENQWAIEVDLAAVEVRVIAALTKAPELRPGPDELTLERFSELSAKLRARFQARADALDDAYLRRSAHQTNARDIRLDAPIHLKREWRKEIAELRRRRDNYRKRIRAEREAQRAMEKCMASTEAVCEICGGNHTSGLAHVWESRTEK